MVIYTSSLHRLTWPVYFRGNAPSVSPERSPSSWNASAKWPQCSSNTQACYAERTERKSLQWMLEKQYSGKENISNGLWSATVELKFDARWPFSGVIQLPSAQRCQWGISSLRHCYARLWPMAASNTFLEIPILSSCLSRQDIFLSLFSLKNSVLNSDIPEAALPLFLWNGLQPSAPQQLSQTAGSEGQWYELF